MKDNPQMRIPDEYTTAFNDFFTMTVEKRKAFFSELKKTRIELTSSRIAQKISSKIKVSVTKLENIIEMFVSLYAFIESNTIPVSELVNSLKISAEDFGIKAKKSDWIAFQNQLKELIKNKDESIGLISKAVELYGEYQNLFIDARTLTDLRPVFKSNIQEDPVGGIIIHNLKIIYRNKNSTRNRQIFIALDNSDLDTLIRILERAKEKSKTLYKCIDQKVFPCIDNTEGE